MIVSRFEHPLTQRITAQRFNVGLEHPLPRETLHIGNAPGPLRLANAADERRRWQKEFAPITFDILAPVVELAWEFDEEAPFAYASIRFYLSEGTRLSIENRQIYVNDAGHVFMHDINDPDKSFPKRGYFVDPRAIKAEEALIVEGGSERWRAHAKAQAKIGGYTRPPVHLFRRKSGYF